MRKKDFLIKENILSWWENEHEDDVLMCKKNYDQNIRGVNDVIK